MMMTKSSTHVKQIFLFIAFLYGIHFLDYLVLVDIKSYGILPRDLTGLRGVAFAPIIHGDMPHLVSNTVPLMILMGVTFVFYPRHAKSALLIIWILGGLLTWIFGREAIHIGASGLVYGFAGFLVARGFVEKSAKTLMIAILVIIVYGGLVQGLFPVRAYISWEAHLFGAIAGVFGAFQLRVDKKT